MVQKGTAATLDMAAVAAYAARLFRNDPELKTFADTCLAAAISGWNWARANPDSVYDQNANNLNEDWVTKINTGGYGDGSFADEFNWAASELFLTTQIDSFATAQGLATKAFASPWSELGWPNVGTLGWLSLLSNKDLLTGSLAGIGPRLDSSINAMGVVIRDAGTKNAYRIPKGGYYWGSNAVFANNGILLWKAWQATKDTTFRDASLETLDYLLGRNPTGYCFVTGFGGKSPLHPHHRPSGADTVKAPVPGFLAGGPNGNYKNDDKDIADLYPGYPNTLGPKAYLDVQTSYASNEVAINWNAPLAYLAGVWSASLPPMAVGTGITSRTAKNGARLDLATRKGFVSANMPGHTLARLEILGIDGRTVARSSAVAPTIELRTSGHGLFLVRAVSTTGIAATSRILIP
jgi:endoglucanase